MREIEEQVLDLLSNAEMPLYSLLASLSRSFGGRCGVDALLTTIADMRQRAVITLWHIDYPSGVRCSLEELPSDLLGEYDEIGHSDATYDPFGYSIALALGVRPAR